MSLFVLKSWKRKSSHFRLSNIVQRDKGVLPCARQMLVDVCERKSSLFQISNIVHRNNKGKKKKKKGKRVSFRVSRFFGIERDGRNISFCVFHLFGTEGERRVTGVTNYGPGRLCIEFSIS